MSYWSCCSCFRRIAAGKGIDVGGDHYHPKCRAEDERRWNDPAWQEFMQRLLILFPNGPNALSALMEKLKERGENDPEFKLFTGNTASKGEL